MQGLLTFLAIVADFWATDFSGMDQEPLLIKQMKIYETEI